MGPLDNEVRPELLWPLLTITLPSLHTGDPLLTSEHVKGGEAIT